MSGTSITAKVLNVDCSGAKFCVMVADLHAPKPSRPSSIAAASLEQSFNERCEQQQHMLDGRTDSFQHR